jgi:hypothetical protein
MDFPDAFLVFKGQFNDNELFCIPKVKLDEAASLFRNYVADELQETDRATVMSLAVTYLDDLNSRFTWPFAAAYLCHEMQDQVPEQHMLGFTWDEASQSFDACTYEMNIRAQMTEQEARDLGIVLGEDAPRIGILSRKQVNEIIGIDETKH